MYDKELHLIGLNSTAFNWTSAEAVWFLCEVSNDYFSCNQQYARVFGDAST